MGPLATVRTTPPWAAHLDSFRIEFLPPLDWEWQTRQSGDEKSCRWRFTNYTMPTAGLASPPRKVTATLSRWLVIEMKAAKLFPLFSATFSHFFFLFYLAPDCSYWFVGQLHRTARKEWKCFFCFVFCRFYPEFASWWRSAGIRTPTSVYRPCASRNRCWNWPSKIRRWIFAWTFKLNVGADATAAAADAADALSWLRKSHISHERARAGGMRTKYFVRRCNNRQLLNFSFLVFFFCWPAAADQGR